jgi:lipopolysaccharide transport system ATP-binding protein
MRDSSADKGRTVLFVSHNMESIKQLCSNGIYLANGQLQGIGDIKSIIENYESQISSVK